MQIIVVNICQKFNRGKWEITILAEVESGFTTAIKQHRDSRDAFLRQLEDYAGSRSPKKTISGVRSKDDRSFALLVAFHCFRCSFRRGAAPPTKKNGCVGAIVIKRS